MYRWPLLPALLALYGCAVPPARAAAPPAPRPVVAPAVVAQSAPPPSTSPAPPSGEALGTMDDDVDDELD